MTRLNFLKSAVLTAGAVLLLSSCGDKEEPKTDITVEDETALTQTTFADETSGKSGITFVTAGAWTSTITEGTTKSTKAGTSSWVSITPDHGDAAGTYTIIISLESNTTGYDRSATITISCNGMDITITVTQKGTGVSANDEDDDADEREMLIALYKSTNGDNWIRKDNWCSDKPISEWYGVRTWKWHHNESVRNRVESIELPNNNLTGSVYLANLKSLYRFDILDGNKIESLTIDNCGNKLPDENMNNYNSVFQHSSNYSQCNLKSLKISNTNAFVYADGSFSADSVIISDCNLSAQEYIYFDPHPAAVSTSVVVGVLIVSNCTMGYFYANKSTIGNIIIDNCKFLADEHGNNAYIYVGNRTQVNNCRGLRYIYSSRKCSDLIVTNTICNDIQCQK